MDFDLLIKDATVVDGSGAPGFGGDVAVAGERIAAVGKFAGANAGRVIEGAGKAVSPGFVDAHGHSDYSLVILPTADSKVLQGVTTEVGGNCGYSAAPVAGKVAQDRRAEHQELFGLDCDWTTFAQYLGRLERERPAINFAPLIGFNTVRGSAGEYSKGVSESGLAAMKAMIREGLEAGAFGMSLGLIYAPGSFADLAELTACAKEAAAVGGLVTSHIRSEGDHLIEAITESMAIARDAGVRFQVSHLKTSGNANWGKLERVFELVEAAQKAGCAVAADRYPYIASGTNLSAALPDWIFEGGKDAFFARLDDPAARERVRQEFKHGDPLGDRYERIVIAATYDPELDRWLGKSVAEAAAGAKQDPLDFLCAVVRKTQDRAAAIYHTMSTGNLMSVMQKDWVMAGSDSTVRTASGVLSEGMPHPRAYGTMPRILAYVVREKQWLSLETAVRRMTHDPCAAFGLKDRGLIQPGLYADLVLFDPDRIKDTATFDNPKQYPRGIDLVVVNGKIAAENGKLTPARAGKVLRRGG